MESKNQLRIKVKKVNQNIRNKKEKSNIINKLLLLQIKKNNNKRIFSFIPLKQEPNISPTNSNLIKNDYEIYIPIYHKNSWKICEIRSKKIYRKLKDTPSPNEILVLTPGLAFTKDGKRLGHGQGVYDRFLERCSAIKIGICFDNQIIKNIPQYKHDVKVDFVLTQNNFYKCK